jgi:signal transduction histidine kinase/ligand-binding sensor domain-containing protein
MKTYGIMIKKSLLIALLILPAILIGQTLKERGFPFIRNYSPEEYRGHAQNFAIIQDRNGIIYTGNFAGVLQFDGEQWRLIQTEQTTKVSALAVDDADNIYVGARGEIGLLETGPYGNLFFRSLLENPSVEIPEFFDILQIYIIGDTKYFIADNLILTISGTQHDIFQSNEKIMGAYCVNDTILLQVETSGLVIFEGNALRPVPNSSMFTSATPVNSIIQLNNGTQLIATGTQGLFLRINKQIRPFASELNEFALSNPVSSLIQLSDGTIAAGTIRSGIAISTPDGMIIQIINKEASLQNSSVRSLFASGENTLWVALNNGISQIDIPYPLTSLNENAGLEGAVNQIIRHKGFLYVATFQGLFYYVPDKYRFEPVRGILSSCWSLLEWNGLLLAATSQGIYQITDHQASLLQDGFALSLALSANKPGSVFVGTTNGFFEMQISARQTIMRQIKGLDKEIRNLVVTSAGQIWGVTLTMGAFRYDPEAETVTFFNKDNSVIGNLGLTLHVIQDRLFLTSESGVFTFSEPGQSFDSIRIVDPVLFPGTEWYGHLYGQAEGLLWITDGDDTGIRLLESVGGKTTLITEPFRSINHKVIQTIYSESNSITWLGGPDGLIRYDRQMENRNVKPATTLIRMITAGNDSLLYLGDKKSIKEWLGEKIIELNFEENTVIFSFAAPFFSSQNAPEYSFYLEGFDDTPGEWTRQTTKEYTNLPAGSYTFYVKARTIYGYETPYEQFPFRIFAPWYLTGWAVSLYIFIAFILVYLIVAARNRKLVKEKKLLEEKIIERTAEVVQQKEEIENQSLELANKNDELEKINSAIKSINAEINFENLLQSLLEKMKIIRASEKSIALVLEKTSGNFRFKAAYGWNIQQFDQITLSLAQAETRYLKDTQEVFEDVFLKSDFSSFDQLNELKEIIRPKSMMILVIRVENKVEAFIIFENFMREHAFEAKDISLIKNSKEHIISAIIRTRILEDLQQTLNDLKDTQDQLVQSEKLASLGQLTAGIAHEIQNPLNFVNNFSSLSIDLADELMDVLQKGKDQLPDKIYDEVDEVIGLIKSNVIKIHEHGKRVESIVKGMLQHSRGKTGEFEQVDLNAMVDEYVNLAYHGMKAQNKSFNTSIRTVADPAIQKVSIIPQDLSRVILNIVNNACYAVDQKMKKNIPDYKPEVLISTRKVKDKVEIRIRDNGTGIPKDVMEKVFNPFFTTKPTGQGTGLGLSMSFDIVNKIHKGKLEVNSEEGVFTEFIITIPEIQH